MDYEDAKVGMRVAFTPRARRVRGIILKDRDPNVQGMITRIGEELIRVHWDDNVIAYLNPYWIRSNRVKQIERERVDRRKCPAPRGPQKRVLVPKGTVLTEECHAPLSDKSL